MGSDGREGHTCNGRSGSEIGSLNLLFSIDRIYLTFRQRFSNTLPHVTSKLGAITKPVPACEIVLAGVVFVITRIGKTSASSVEDLASHDRLLSLQRNRCSSIGFGPI